ncbi:hypothetical protein OK016_02885 [Vibrio chagasii]|nr:hypothetical protein [Vibrio chagasii]
MSTSSFAANDMYALGGVGINEDDTGLQFTAGLRFLIPIFILNQTMN